MKVLLVAATFTCAAWGQFEFRDVDAKSVELRENGAPVFVYNHGMMLKEGAPADRTRCCYLHPVYAPNGVVITDDFPRDHFHHRGISWMWPVVIVDGKTYDLWTIKGILAKAERFTKRETRKDRAVLAFVNGWYLGDRKVVEEEVEITAYPAKAGRRDIDFTMRFKSVGAGVEIAGSPDANKGYGGFNIRFAPRTATRLDTANLSDTPDTDMVPNAWAELTGDYGGKRTRARITVDPSSAGFPNGWCLRHYGFLGANYPGLKPVKLSESAPLLIKARVTLADAGTASSKRSIPVYTTKGYVRDNVASSVATSRRFDTALGHKKEDYADPAFYRIIPGGIQRTMGDK